MCTNIKVMRDFELQNLELLKYIYILERFVNSVIELSKEFRKF